jgi:hypothetical protein
MHRVIPINRLLLVLLFASQVLFFAACKAKCLPGSRLEGGSCKKLGLEEAAGMGLPVTAAGVGGDNAARASTANASQSDSGSDGSSGSGASPTSGSRQQPANGGASTPSSGSANPTESEPCDAEGSTRCAPSAPQGTRETCMGKVWIQSAPCAANETCVVQQGSAECAAVEKLCIGSNGQPVCDGQGTLLLCNEDGTVKSQEMCNSAKLCQAGISVGQCALCAANEEYRCTDKSLELCGSDGMSFAAHTECETAALCNPTLGMCTAAVCMPGAFSCDNNTLKVCNADGTGFDEARSMPCGSGTCDAKGMDCNKCEPGMQMCMGDSAAVCDETGQTFEPMPCGSGMRCVGAGNCVECAANDDCSELTKDCVVGACVQNKCQATNASRGTQCMAGSRPGTCSSGTCECTKQCNKPCGADGCGGQCPDTCGDRMCVNDACVECTTNAHCSDQTTADGCVVGVCSNGNCDTMNASRTACTTESGERGTCTNGDCVCTSDCGRDHCAMDSCGRSCTFSCGSGEECSSNVCRRIERTVPGRCTVGGACPGDNYQICDSTLLYCTTYCPTDCPTGWECVGGLCALLPPCPSGMIVATLSGYQACGYPHPP